MRRRRGLLPLVLSLGGALACATTGTPWAPPRSAVVEPWELPPDAYPSQRLYRVGYDGPEGRLQLKLTLYLRSPQEFQLHAAGMGRQLWALSIEPDGRVVFLDHRHDEVCYAGRGRLLALAPIADLPLVALPRLLLGRLPATPAAELARSPDSLSYRDAAGQLWQAGLTAGDPDWWSLGERGEALAWWHREERGGRFTDRRDGQLVRWEERVREPLSRPPSPLVIPPSYRPVPCVDDGAATGG